MKPQEKIERAKEIVALLDENDPDKAEILENETDIYSLIDWAIRKDAEASAAQDMNKGLSQLYAGRVKLLKARQEKLRNWITCVMDSINETSYKGDLGTISISALGKKPIVTDIGKLPDDCVKTEQKPIMAEVKKYLEQGGNGGAEWSNGGQSISIRRK